MGEQKRQEFIALWRAEARPRIRQAVQDLVPDLEVDGRPGTAPEAAFLLKQLVSVNFERFLQEALPAGLVLSEQERADVKQITLELLDEEIHRHDQ